MVGRRSHGTAHQDFRQGAIRVFIRVLIMGVHGICHGVVMRVFIMVELSGVMKL